KAETFPTLVSGFVDPGPMAEALLGSADADTACIVRELLGASMHNGGRDWSYDLRGVTFRCGFEGKAWRDSVVLHTHPRRRAVWQLLQATQPVDLDHLPALPADAGSVCIFGVDFPKMSKAVSGLVAAISKDAGDVKGRTDL